MTRTTPRRERRRQGIRLQTVTRPPTSRLGRSRRRPRWTARRARPARRRATRQTVRPRKAASWVAAFAPSGTGCSALKIEPSSDRKPGWIVWRAPASSWAANSGARSLLWPVAVAMSHAWVKVHRLRLPPPAALRQTPHHIEVSSRYSHGEPFQLRRLSVNGGVGSGRVGDVIDVELEVAERRLALGVPPTLAEGRHP